MARYVATFVRQCRLQPPPGQLIGFGDIGKSSRNLYLGTTVSPDQRPAKNTVWQIDVVGFKSINP